LKRANHQNLLLYWTPKTTDDVLSREDTLEYAASDQFGRVSPGDVIWVVTVRAGELFLLGKLYVGEVTDRNGAMKRLGKKDVWGDKKFYAIAIPGMVEPLREISLSDVAGQLVFKSRSGKSSRLALDAEGKVNAQQLQTMRILEASSVDLFEQMWRL